MATSTDTPRLPLSELLEAYPPGTGVIRYQDADGEHIWFVGAKCGIDNEETLRDHLAKWRPGAKFLEGAVK